MANKPPENKEKPQGKESPKPAARASAPVVVRSATLSARMGDQGTGRRLLMAGVASLLLNGGMLGAMWAVAQLSKGGEPARMEKESAVVEAAVDEQPAKEEHFETEDVGINPDVPELNYNLSRENEPVSIPGVVNNDQPIGIPGGTDTVPQNVPPPPGFGGNTGTGAGVDSSTFGKAPTEGFAGGMGGPLMLPGGIGGRSGATRKRMVEEGGGTTASEAAVARGLHWLHLHQDPDGKWSLADFNQHSLRETSPGTFVRDRCNCDGPGRGGHDVAGTAFGLLPLLGAGYTHKGTGSDRGTPLGKEYSKDIERGLKYLLTREKSDGDFGEGMYCQGIATIAMCEAYGLTSDPLLKKPAQMSLNFIVRAQSAAGGWSYTAPCTGHDTSVGGWQLMALKSGQMSGLDVPAKALQGASRWLDGVANADGSQYGYQGPGGTPTMTAVGLLCREYLGWGPRNPGLLKGVQELKKLPPKSGQPMYYYYYATQVMHHMGNESWEFWNPLMRDSLIASQDNGGNAKHPHQRGSWDPKGDQWGGEGGRIFITSLALLTLEVYYRHLPLYRREMGGQK